MKEKTYKQLNENDREEIFRWLKKGFSKRAIAAMLGYNASTISREIKRNLHKKLDYYLPDTAQRKANKRKENGRKQCYLLKDKRLRKYVVGKLMIGWTPELISGRLHLDKGIMLSHETIYQFIYSKEGRKNNYRQYLPRAHRIRKKKNGRKNRKGKIPDRIDISCRPKAVEARNVFGHWEGDSVLYRGHTQCLATQIERKTRYVTIGRPKDRSANERNRILAKIFGKLPPQAVKTMTFDNGLEFAAHAKLSKRVGVKVYFSTPYSSWQRGANERANSILHRYLPRHVNLKKIPYQSIRKFQNEINNRPMKCLQYRTPKEMMKKELARIRL